MGWVLGLLFLASGLLFWGLWQMFAGQFQLERERRGLERARGIQELRKELGRVLERGREQGRPRLEIPGFEQNVFLGSDGSLLPFEKATGREQWEEDSLMLELRGYLDGLREEQRGKPEAALGRYRLALGKKRKAPLPRIARQRLQLAILRAALRAGHSQEARSALESLGKEKLGAEEAWRAARLGLELLRAEKNPSLVAQAKRNLEARLESLRPRLSLLEYWDLRQEIGEDSTPPHGLRLYRFLAAHRSALTNNPEAILVWEEAPSRPALVLLAPARRPEAETLATPEVPFRQVRLLGRPQVLELAWNRSLLADRYAWEPAPPRHQAPAPRAQNGSPAIDLPAIGLRIRLRDKQPMAASFWEAPKGRLLLVLLLLMQAGLGLGLWTTLRAMGRERHLARLRTDFVSSVSHELKTPLTAIRLYSDLLLRAETDPEKRQEYPLRIHEEAQKLSFLVANVLDAARLEAGRSYRKERVDLVERLRSCAHEFEARLRPKGAKLQMHSSEESAWILGDPEALGRVLSNLVDNALKHGGPQIHLRLRALDEDFEVRIEDDGPGIPPTERERLFRPFERGVAHGPGQAPGSGLGLAIVREIVEAHEGASVQMQGLPQGGLALVLRFPKAPQRPPNET